MRERESQIYLRPYPTTGHHIYAIILFSHKGKLHRIPHFSRCNIVRDLNSYNKPSIRSVSYFRSSNVFECRRFECPAVREEQMPFSLIGEYKAASDFKQTTVKTNSGGPLPTNSILSLSTIALLSFGVLLE
ncbi:unnamed protein product [Lymnaea stagnalis]|uniref:Uncharacterized protein n=1 Tax=Lymnaea stagnalis TaxID=6523 RepID=A0AAV2IFY1_LYMST